MTGLISEEQCNKCFVLLFSIPDAVPSFPANEARKQYIKKKKTPSIAFPVAIMALIDIIKLLYFSWEKNARKQEICLK